MFQSEAQHKVGSTAEINRRIEGWFNKSEVISPGSIHAGRNLRFYIGTAIVVKLFAYSDLTIKFLNAEIIAGIEGEQINTAGACTHQVRKGTTHEKP